MKILIGDNWNVDFDGPIPMTESQQELFVKFMETIFNPIKKVETNTFRTERIGDKIFLRGWDDDEIVMLFNTNMTLVSSQPYNVVNYIMYVLHNQFKGIEYEEIHCNTY